MIDLKLECYSCGYNRIISEKEFIEDIQQCPRCGSDNIEIISMGDSQEIKKIDPAERERIVKGRMLVIFVIGAALSLGGVVLFSIPGGWGLFPVAVTLLIIGALFLIIAISWFTSGTCFCACTNCVG